MPIDLQIATIGSQKCKTNRGGFVKQLQFRCPCLALPERDFMLPSLGKEGGENERAERSGQNASLSHQDALGAWKARVTKNAYCKRRRPNNCKGNDERRGGTKYRAAASCQPKQKWE